MDASINAQILRKIPLECISELSYKKLAEIFMFSESHISKIIAEKYMVESPRKTNNTAFKSEEDIAHLAEGAWLKSKERKLIREHKGKTILDENF